jgi:hypothetical protein
LFNSTHYQIAITYKPNQGQKFTEDFVLDCKHVAGERWRAKVIFALSGYRTDIIFPDGDRLVDAQPGLMFYFNGAGVSTSYGFNAQASQADYRRPQKLLIMDYKTSIVDYDGLNSDDDLPWLSMAPRHFRGVNALMSDSSVQRVMLPQLDAATQIYAVAPGQCYTGAPTTPWITP